MDLSGLLEYHSAVSVIFNQTTYGQSLLYQSSDVPELVNGNTHWFHLPFKITRKPNTSTSGPIAYRLNFENGNFLKCYVNFGSNHVDKDKFNMRLVQQTYIGGYTTNYTSYYAMNINTTYNLVMSIQVFSQTSMRWDCMLYSIDPQTGELDTMITSFPYWISFNPNSSTLSNVQVRVGNTNLNVTMLVYEPHYEGYNTNTRFSEQFCKHMLFGEPRYHYFSYSSPAHLIRTYLLPPKEAFEGTIYDQTDLLNDQIEELEDDVAQLQADLDAKESIFTKLGDMFDETGDFVIERFFDLIKHMMEDIGANPSTYFGGVS